MQEAVPVGVGTMAAIIGLDSEAVKECCKKASSEGIVEPANFKLPGPDNCCRRGKGSGEGFGNCKRDGSKKGNASCRERPVPLQHAKACGDKLAAELERVTLGDMQIPVVTNVTAEYIIDKDKVKDLLIRQVSSSVLLKIQ